jgi:HEAT repeat protein
VDEASLIENLRRLEATADALERNALALDLSETGDPRVFDVLVRLIKRPDLENRRGTLVYCLENFDCSSVADLLVNLVETGNFEVAAHAEIILDEQALR